MILSPIKVVDIELSRPIPHFTGLERYMGLQGLVRLHGVPLGYVKAPITLGHCTAQTLSKLILEQHQSAIVNQILKNGLAASVPLEKLSLEDLLDISPPQYQGTLPLVTVAVCTRDRPADIVLCLDALGKLDYPHLDLLVVDNAPTSDATKHVVEQYSNVRYVCEPRPGLDWARNRAILEAKGEILAYTDDDVVVDQGWVRAIANLFAENPQVMAVTGLVVPYELETEPQILFEMYGGFGRGFERRWFRIGQDNRKLWGLLGTIAQDNKMPWNFLGTGQFGTGANMAYRRCIFNEVGQFDPALDVGTVTNGGGDLEMFFRVLKEGHTLVYEPNAIVRHRHRQDYAKLRAQLKNNSMGLLAYCIRSVQAYPDEWPAFVRLWIWWLRNWNLGRLFLSTLRPMRFPRDLVLAELQGCFTGLNRYQQARRQASRIAEDFGGNAQLTMDCPQLPQPRPTRRTTVAVRTVELSQALQPLVELAEYSNVRIFVTWKHQPIGSVEIANGYHAVSAMRLREAIVAHLPLKLLASWQNLSPEVCQAKAIASITEHYTPAITSASDGQQITPKLVSVVVATCDRPDDLRNCLRCLVEQQTTRPFEIIAVDNNPSTSLTSEVVAEFPEVILIRESRKGLSYARNAGIVASKGEVIVFTDDDVTMPPDWLENLVTPFTRTDVMAVTGNVLPIELTSISQRFFERYGGLGRGFEPFEVKSDWFDSFLIRAVPTWEIGATANAAFRASIFSHSQIGLLDETLGVGTPTGCSEDTYLFYKILKAGYTILYQPEAYVYHRHRSDMLALRRQIYNYSKGHVAYHLKTLMKDGDGRGLVRVLVELPLIHLLRIKTWLQGASNYPMSLILLEIRGNLAGPWSLWRSHQRVKREGRSTPYIPVSQRPAIASESTQVVSNHDIQSVAGFSAQGANAHAS